MADDKNISYLPTDGLCYDPSEDKYWDEGALGKEVERAFEICHGCRMCFKYCDSFPDLFSLIDEADRRPLGHRLDLSRSRLGCLCVVVGRRYLRLALLGVWL